jgi:hypothetical protein
VSTKGERYVQGLLGTTVWSVPELFGVEPPKYVREFQQDYPLSGFGASMAGSSVPYLGWYKASKNIKKFDDFIEGIGNINKAPILSTGLREAARFAPFEASRVLGNQLIGDKSFGEMIGSAAINEALMFGAGSLVGALRAAGKRQKTAAEYIKDLNTYDPPQLQLRFLEQNRATRLPEELPSIDSYSAGLRDIVRSERAPDFNYVSPLEGVDRDAKRLNWLFDAEEGLSTQKAVVRRKFVNAQDHFRSDIDWQNAMGQFGVNPIDMERFAQYPRLIEARSDRAAKIVQKSVHDTLAPIGDGWFMGKEQSDGLFVMAKSIPTATKEVPNRWMVFKTDSPDYFNQAGAQWGSTIVKANAWARREADAITDAGPVVKQLDEFMEQVPLENYTLVEQAQGKGLSTFKTLAKMSGMEKLGLHDSEAVARVRDFFKRYFTPTLYQTRGSPRATYIIGASRAVVEGAEDLAQRMMHGTFDVEQSRSLISQAMASAKPGKSGGLRAQIDELTDDEIQQIAQIFREAPPVESLPAIFSTGKLTPNAYSVAQELYRLSGQLADDIIKTEKAFGLNMFRKKNNNMLIPREWEGELGIAVRDKANKLRGVAVGYNNRDAERNLATMLSRHPEWTAAERFNRSDGRLPRDVANLFSSSFYNPRTDIEGFKWNYENFTRKELIDAVEAAIKSRTQRQANLAIEYKLKGQVDQLAIEDPRMYRIVQERINDLRREQRPLAKIQNALADKILAPVIGNNSASKIAAWTNMGMWHFELGGFRLGYILLNALTPIQTVLPEIAFTLNSSPAKLGNYYSFFAGMGSKGPVGTLGVLSPLKLMAATIRDMRKPDDVLTALFQRAVNDRVIDPRVVEDYIGESAAKVTDLKRAISGGGQFVDWLRAVSEFLPAQSERFSRAYAFSAGTKLAREFFGVTDRDTIYRFARQFTTRTMYQYGQADRAAVMTTPAGGVFGLFKNWMMHYMITMLEYTGEGVKHGNWSPLLWQQAATWGLGGLAASPIYALANQFNDFASDQTLMENAYEAMGQEGADSLFYGLPHVLGNISLTSQVSSPLSNPMRDAQMIFSIVHYDRMKYASMAFGQMMDQWNATGQHPGYSESVRDLMVRAFAPKTIYRLIQSVQEDGIQSLSTGYSIMPNASAYDRLLFASGMNPTEIERQYAVADMLYRDRDRRRSLVAAAGEAYKDAMLRKDSKEMWFILRGALKQGLDPNSILQSAAQRYQNEYTPMLDRTFSPEAIYKYRKILGD